MSRFSRFWLPLLFLLACSPSSEKSGTADTVSGDSTTLAAADAPGESQKEGRVILFFGNSLTAGYGLDLTQAFPSLIQQYIDSLGMGYNVVNGGLSGETTATGKNRITWMLREQVDVLVVELGANDGLRGIPVAETRKNLQEIIDIARGKYPDIRIILCGMEVPPNMGPEYQQEFRTIFKELATANETSLVPFLLDGVAGEPDLNLADGIHPTVEGHKLLARNVWAVLGGMLSPL